MRWKTVALAALVLIVVSTAIHEAVHIHQFSSLGIPTYQVCVLGWQKDRNMGFGGKFGGWTVPEVQNSGQYRLLESKRSEFESTAYTVEFSSIILMVSFVYLAGKRW